MLSRIADEVLDDRLRWLLKETGEPRPICAPVAEDVSRIAGEAMFNALRHAHATLLSLRIDHTPEG
jgi:signal transduction histidine kinase